MTHEYETYPFADIADHLRAVRLQYEAGEPLTWTGPDRIHYSIAATVPEPSWYFSPEGLEHERDQGRGFWDAFVQVAFMFGWHNSIVKHEQSETVTKEHDRMLMQMALNALEAGDIDLVKAHLNFLKDRS